MIAFMRSRRRLVVALCVVSLLAGFGLQSALAVTPNDVQYNPTTTAALKPPPQSTPPSSSSGVKGSQTPTPLATATSGGTLPFTGLDLGVASAVGAFLVAGGFALRRLGRKSSQSKS
jgi:hypothetical protein